MPSRSQNNKMLFDILDNMQDDLMHELYDEAKIYEFKAKRQRDLQIWNDDESDDEFNANRRNTVKVQGVEQFRLRDVNVTSDDYISESEIELENSQDEA
mmetsp:Transcript_34776/g.45763  ORF Transcript_34776/g.45763 Transcript_34776/m.45763 type:complete len:99 (+) Transcript_34776:95-391(+)